jgi:hypothetical protein
MLKSLENLIMKFYKKIPLASETTEQLNDIQ